MGLIPTYFFKIYFALDSFFSYFGVTKIVYQIIGERVHFPYIDVVFIYMNIKKNKIFFDFLMFIFKSILY